MCNRMSDSNTVLPTLSSSSLQDETVEKMWGTVEAYQGELESEGEIRDGIRTVVREVDRATKKAMFSILSLHAHPQEENIKIIGDHTKSMITEEIAPLLLKLEEKIPRGGYYKYSDLWRFSFQKVCSVSTLCHYFIFGSIPTLAEMSGLMKIPSVTDKKEFTLFVDFDEYLFGLLELGGELSRLSRNLITFGGSVERVYSIHRLMNDLSAAMHNVTFKNDFLRKKYDGLKYQLRSVEEVIYDLKMQSVKPTGQASPDAEPAEAVPPGGDAPPEGVEKS